MAPATERIARILGRQDWRRYAPAGAALVLHVLVMTVMIAMLPAQSLATVAPPPKPPEMVLKVELVEAAPEPSPPPEGRRPAPPDQKKAPPQPEPSLTPLTDTPTATADDPKKKKQQAINGPPPPAPGGAESQQGGVFLGDGSALSGVPLGLRSLYEKDSCETLESVLAKNCKDTWTTKLARNDIGVSPTIAELQAMYPGLSVSDIVGFHMGGAAQPKHAPMLQQPFDPNPTGAALGGITSVGGQLPHWRSNTRIGR